MSKRPPVVVRRAEVRDAEALCATFAAPKAMAGTLQLPLPSVEMWRKRISDAAPEDYFLVAEANGEVVGNAGLHAAGRTARRRHAGTIGIIVRDDWQGRGVGNALMTTIVDIADNWLNYRRIELTVYTDNAPAIALYRKFGFEMEGKHREYAYRNGEYVDAYAMARVRDTKNRKPTKTARKRS